MTAHDPSHSDVTERAATYLAGAMPAAEAADLESRLADPNDSAASEVAALAPVVEALLDSVAPAEPGSAVRATLLRRMEDSGAPAEPERKQVWKGWGDDGATQHLVIANAVGTGWEDTDIDGIAVRRLSVDRDRNQTTMLVRMAAGTGYPSHIHDGPEECLVLEGDLRVGDEHHLHAGDFQRMAPGSRHGYQSTDGGCLLLIVSSLSDKLD